MNFKKILLLSFILLCGCNQVNKNEKSFNFIIDRYSNTGFTLIYSDQLKKNNRISKKIDNRSLLIFHKDLQGRRLP